MQCTDHRAVPIPLLVLAVCSFINKHCSLLHSYISSLQSPKGKRHTESCKEAACNLTGSIHFLVFRAVPGTLQNFWEIQEGHQPTQISSLQSISGQVYQRTTAHCEQLQTCLTLTCSIMDSGTAAPVTLCFRAEILVLWKNKKEKCERKKIPINLYLAAVFMCLAMSHNQCPF